jgi:hypothetical protein
MSPDELGEGGLGAFAGETAEQGGVVVGHG